MTHLCTIPARSMFEAVPQLPPTVRPTLVHLVVGAVLVIWNALGLALALSAQFGVMQLTGADAAYFESLPFWFILFADLGLLCGVAGALALVLQHRSAPWLFAAQITSVGITTIYELVMREALLSAGEATIGLRLFAATILVGQLLYARYLQRQRRIF